MGWVHDPTTTWVLTGAIGTGKSTVGSMLAARGARVIDADRIGHAVIDSSGPAFAAVAQRWPEAVVGGHIDRRRLGEIVFGDAGELAELEAITHPHIVARLRELMDAANPGPAVVEVSVPHLPVDPRWGRIVVLAGSDIRRQRLLDRGLGVEEIEQRMAAQPAAEDWVHDGDLVVSNDGDLDDLERQVDELWSELRVLQH